ncbi:MAG TPA: hypothetical protein VGN09_15970 [Vicinamibacteria bacterium]|jgi:hypothetical protein
MRKLAFLVPVLVALLILPPPALAQEVGEPPPPGVPGCAWYGYENDPPGNCTLPMLNCGSGSGCLAHDIAQRCANAFDPDAIRALEEAASDTLACNCNGHLDDPAQWDDCAASVTVYVLANVAEAVFDVISGYYLVKFFFPQGIEVTAGANPAPPPPDNTLW